MTTIKAIETEYAGCRFRSRLEARWAVFFDHAGIRWDYESQGYRMSDGARYLPDFRLPDRLSQYVEVKGTQEALEADADRIQAFADEMPARVLVLGPIPEVPLGAIPHSVPLHLAVGAGHAPRLGTFVQMMTTRSVTFGASPGWRLDCGVMPGVRGTEELEAAYQAARRARFEFGERG